MRWSGLNASIHRSQKRSRIASEAKPETKNFATNDFFRACAAEHGNGRPSAD